MSSIVESSSNETQPNTNELHYLLSNTEFIFLVLFSCGCHYTALVFSTLAVGESTSSLLLPFAVLKSLLLVIIRGISRIFHKRQQNVFVGVEYEEDGADIENFDAFNQPTEAGFK